MNALQRDLRPFLSFLALAAACEGATEGLGARDPRADAGAADASFELDAGIGAGCSTPNPAGCGQTACAPSLICDRDLGCAPSSCTCADGSWSCTRDCGGGVCRVPSLTFRLSYAGDRAADTLFVQSWDNIGIGWITIWDAAGERVLGQSSCGYCACEPCGSCYLCDSAPPTANSLASGEAVEWQWDVTAHPLSRCALGPSSTQECQRAEPLREGRYVARFCYGYGIASGQGGGSFVDNPICSEVRFDWPTQQALIEHQVIE